MTARFAMHIPVALRRWSRALRSAAAAVGLAHATLGGCARDGVHHDRDTLLGLDEFFTVPQENPLTHRKVQLGCRLFFDPLLSADRSVSCASCHRPEHAFADTVARSRGVYGRTASRNTPSLLNVAYARFLSWDGAAASLEEQALRPIHNPLEMDLPLPVLVERLRAQPEYRRAFHAAFVDDDISATLVARALASFLRTLRAGGAAVDRYRAGDATALSAAARHGFEVFAGKGRCTSCHLGPMLSDDAFHNTGVSWGTGDSGRFMLSGSEHDGGVFNTPSLRNVARTAPYMHDGSMRTLEDVIEFYDRGGQPNPRLDRDIEPLRLNTQEQRALLTFLKSLTGSPADWTRPCR
ncbi:MAG TPA: cytochrome c peroxidase [Longimicrobiales bacterium]|nr:cytochrome c peroxidase [Longimicrobiales bacterium]